MSWFGTRYTVTCGGCSETVIYSGYSKSERDKYLTYGDCGKCRVRRQKREQDLEDRKYEDRKEKQREEAAAKKLKREQEHEKMMKDLEKQSKKEKREAIEKCIKEMKTTISDVDDTILETGDALTKEKANLATYTATKEGLGKTIDNFDAYKEKRLGEYNLHIGLDGAEEKYNRDRDEVHEAISKTGVHSKDVGRFLALTHGLIGATMNTQAETNRLDVALSTFGVLLNKECQDKLTVDYFFQDKNLKEFIPILEKEGYVTIDHLTCDNENQFETDILKTLDKGIKEEEKRAREDAENRIKEITGEVEEAKKKLEKVQKELKEIEDENAPDEKEEPKKDEKEEEKTDGENQKESRTDKIKRLSGDKIKLEENIKTYNGILREEQRKLNYLENKEKERQTKGVGGDEADDEQIPQTDKTGDDLCEFLLKEFGFSDEVWKTFKEEGWDDAEDWHEITEEDLKNDLGFTKKPKIKKFIRVIKKWKNKNEKEEKEKERKEQEQKEQDSKQSFMYLKQVEIRELKRICLKPGKEEWGRYEKEKAEVIKSGLLQLSPVLGDFFGNMNGAIKQTEDLINYKKELSNTQLKAIASKNQNIQKLEAIEWRRKDVDSRKRWKEKTQVEIYLNSSKEWVVGTIIEVKVDEEGEWLTIQYVIKNETKTKQVQKYNMNVIRTLKIEDENYDVKIDDEKESIPMSKSLMKPSDNQIAIQSGALIAASVVSVCVTDTMLDRFAVSPTTERGLGMALGVEDCCKQLIKNQGEIRQAVFLAQEILGHKPANMSKQKTIKLWTAVDAGIIRIFDSALKMVRVAAEYFGFFLRFQNSFKFFISCYSNGRDVSLFTSLERLKKDVRDFNKFKNEFSKSVIELNATAMECIGNCVKESIGYLNWEATQSSLKDSETEYLKVRKMSDIKSLKLDDELEKHRNDKIEEIAKEAQSTEQISIFNAKLESDGQYKIQCEKQENDLQTALTNILKD